MAIRPGGKGNVTHSHVAWHQARLPSKEASYVPSPVFHDKYFFVVSDQGFLSCFEAKTGKRLWMHKLGRRHRSSLLCAGGLLYVTSTEGDTYVVRAGPKFELLAENPLGEECYASPAAAQGNLFIRTAQHLWCLGVAEETKK